MIEILFLSHRIPFPPDRGDKIRSHHILKRLAQIAPVHVATFADDERDFAEEPELARITRSYCLVERRKPLALAGVEALLERIPVSLMAFRSPAISRYVRDLVARRPIGTIYVFSGQMGQYVPASFTGRVIADFVDVDSAKFEAFAAKGSGLRRWIDAREGRLLRAEEARLARRAHVSLLISQSEANLFRSRLPADGKAKIAVRALGNGIDSAFFDPAGVAPAEAMLAVPGPRLVFTGQMDYAPNITAVERVMDRILPAIRQREPAASFHVVGRNPPSRLTDRDQRDGIHVWGRVDDVRPWLKAADMALIPLEIGRGVQNKVLEAMAMTLPVVLTPDAATGIDAASRREFLVAQSDEDLVAAVFALLDDPAWAHGMGLAARDYVLENASWDAALSDLPEIVDVGARTARHAS
ncbi:TIGR03087 family PEP-CTERM/XrtA system glycosyltransferase [Novosphingobium album (ex Liu et al. 2023)]|uniref:TIGR03087 family PEP-CTERM/XrtA system glycosyltransferase n=1 Tax=Novosphingobium album (ex Liu et al. 2023) TaxID=3031130 RepID=A0ABT5WUH5_9SPHN|nr:TIGR03087 family PEP-CTERM/XrtA system glycosyltransferase [Novosphingobium album (ex Liu et al. 2023)]MDE8653533.1 TIGR03087 family PEP-CTERM/XrtA system glycosyltransferase [Novosphingobium album (ex Liu et al. 2023)]